MERLPQKGPGASAGSETPGLLLSFWHLLQLSFDERSGNGKGLDGALGLGDLEFITGGVFFSRQLLFIQLLCDPQGFVGT